MIFSNIKQFFKQNKKIFYYIGFFIVIFALSSDITFAEPAASTTKDTTKELIDTVAISAEFFLKGISVLLALITFLATMFLSPEWINGSLFGLNTYFKDIWILVSNVVYFAFAFILIWVAFMNIIGKNNDQYQLKQALPKFIVGVLIVPFSWFLIQFILSISAILTVSALTLPFDTFNEFETGLSDVKIPQQCTLDLSKIGTGSGAESFIKCPTENPMTLNTVMSRGNAIESIYGIISMYTYGILSFDTVGDVSKDDFKVIRTLGELVVKIVFDLLFVVVYSILIITLGIVLMIRGIYIWVYTMISPVFGLMYFFGKKDGGEGFFGKFNVSQFIALAMVPVYTMLALSFGLLFIYVVGTGLTNSTVGQGDVQVKKNGEDSSVNIGNFSLIIKGAVSKDQNATGLLTKIGGGTLGIVGSLILKVFGIVILWGTIMAAMRTSEITKQITQPIYDFGAQVGKIAASAPGNIPIFGGQSMKSMQQVAGNVDSSISQKNNERAQKFTSEHLPFIDPNSVERVSKLNTIGKKVDNLKDSGDRGALKSEYAKLLSTYKGSENLMPGDKNFKEILEKIAKALNVTDFDVGKISNLSSLGDQLRKIEDVFDKNYVGGLTKETDKLTGAALVKELVNAAAGGAGVDDSSGTQKNIKTGLNLNVTSVKKDIESGTIFNEDAINRVSKQLYSQNINGVYSEKEFIQELQASGIIDEKNIKEIIKKINFYLEETNKGKVDETKVEFFKKEANK